MLKKGSISIDDFEPLQKINDDEFLEKIIVKNKKTNEICIARFSEQYKNLISNEVNLFSKLSHPNIAKLIGYSDVDFENKPNPVIITEYCKNGTLRSVLDNAEIGSADASYNNTNILKIIYGISNAMSFLHSHDVVNINLNPKNIFLDDEYNPKIFDLSAAKYCDDDDWDPIITPIYAAPEIFENDEYTKKSDVYAFSMIVFELLTLQKPFTNIKSGFQFAKEVINNKRLTFDKNIAPESYKQLITKCWSQNPDKRPSFDEINQLLKTDHGFYENGVDIDEFNAYVDDLNDYDIKFEEEKEVIPISEDTINQPISKELMMQFQKNPKKN